MCAWLAEPRPACPPAGTNEAGCLSYAFWQLFRAADGEGMSAVAQQAAAARRPLNMVVQGAPAGWWGSRRVEGLA